MAKSKRVISFIFAVHEKVPANEETLSRKHCFPECFLGAQTETMFPCQVNQETENRRLRMPILGNKAYTTTKSSQHCFLGAQTGKHLLRKQNVSENNQKHFLFLGNKKMFPQQMFRSRADRETFRETCFLNGVSATIFPRLQGP